MFLDFLRVKCFLKSMNFNMEFEVLFMIMSRFVQNYFEMLSNLKYINYLALHLSYAYLLVLVRFLLCHCFCLFRIVKCCLLVCCCFADFLRQEMFLVKLVRLFILLLLNLHYLIFQILLSFQNFFFLSHLIFIRLWSSNFFYFIN